jgi:stage II sporulation protein AA (anti-sigma F factor antagonist)
MSDLQIAVSDVANKAIKVIALIGEMDELSLEPMKQKISAISDDPNVKILLFDLSRLEFINSKGIGYFVSVHTHISKFQKSLVLAVANEAVMDVISLVGLTSIIKYFDTVEEAIEKI